MDQYLPTNLEKKSLHDLALIAHGNKSSRIVSLLLRRGKLHLNEIQKLVGGSKTATVEALEMLEKQKIIQSEWEMVTVGEKGPRPRLFAVRAFRINEGRQPVLAVYEPLFRVLAGTPSL
jgi:hypothetical protein